MWLGGGVASGGVGVGFGVGLRVFTLGGVGVPVSGSALVVFLSAHAPVSGSSLAVSGPVSVSGFVVPVSPDAGVGAFDSSGGVRVCSVGACGVWCFVVFFGGGVVGGGCWCGWGES